MRKKSRAKELKRLLAKRFSKKKLLPRPLKRMRTFNKVVKSVQKHQDTYLTGVSAAIYALKKWAR